MALLTDEQKNIFDTTLPANYDAGDGTLNPQPLNIDETGALVVSASSSPIQAKDDVYGANVNVKASVDGSLSGGGWIIPNSLGSNYSTYHAQVNNIAHAEVATYMASITDTMIQWGRSNNFKQVVDIKVNLISASNNTSHVCGSIVFIK